MALFLPVLILALALAAAAFAVWPLLRDQKQRPISRALLGGAIAFFTLAIGVGVYWQLGSPGLALRTLTGPRDDDYPALVAELVSRMREHPDDPRGWLLLAQSYQNLGDQTDALAAYRKGIGLMVAQLDARLRANPDDAQGWQRLIRAYAVLGQTDKAQAALDSARRQFAGKTDVLARLDMQARALKLK